MIRTSLFLCTLVVSCTNSNGTTGPQGHRGEPGAAGAQGAQGTPGATGVCDANTCPSVSSVDGLSGGTINGTTTLSTAVVGGELVLAKGSSGALKGTTIERGDRKTSLGGFYCGVTTFNVLGTFASSTGSPDYAGLQGTFRVAKKHCEERCQSATAHACKPSEIRVWQELGGGSSNVDVAAWRNASVPMPDSPGEYWVASDDIVSDCVASGSGQGLAYSLPGYEGAVSKKDCSTPLPLLCCW